MQFADGNGSADSFYGNGGWDSPEVPPLAPGDFVRPENNIMQIIEVYPEMGPFLMEYGMSCVGCFVSYDEISGRLLRAMAWTSSKSSAK